MGPQKVEKSEAKVKSVGRMIVKTSRETLPYKVLGELMLPFEFRMENLELFSHARDCSR